MLEMLPGDNDAPIPSEEGPVVSSRIPRALTRRTSDHGPLRMPSLLERRSGSVHTALSLDSFVINVDEPRSSEDVLAHFRGWHRMNAGQRMPPAVITAMSYNVLAARYVSTSKYPTCPPWALYEPYRASNILNEIEEIDPDVIFFQELSCEMHSVLLGEKLGTAGYLGFHVPITTRSESAERSASARESTSPGTTRGTLTDSPRLEVEGVAVYYRKDLFESVEGLPIKFNVTASRDTSLQAPEKIKVCINSHNVAAVCALRHKFTNEYLLCACIHSFWDATKPECQLYQIVKLLRQLEEMKSQYEHMGRTRVLLAGDFNAEPHSIPVSYILKQRLPVLSPPRTFPGIADASHSFDFRWCYDEYFYSTNCGSHVTCSDRSDSGVIDLMFCERDCFDVVAVGRVDTRRSMPDPATPSDHFPVCARLALKD